MQIWMRKNASAWARIRFKHPYFTVLINAKIETNLPDKPLDMIMKDMACRQCRRRKLFMTSTLSAGSSYTSASVFTVPPLERCVVMLFFPEIFTAIAVTVHFPFLFLLVWTRKSAGLPWNSMRSTPCWMRKSDVLCCFWNSARNEAASE